MSKTQDSHIPTEKAAGNGKVVLTIASYKHFWDISACSSICMLPYHSYGLFSLLLNGKLQNANTAAATAAAGGRVIQPCHCLAFLQRPCSRKKNRKLKLCQPCSSSWCLSARMSSRDFRVTTTTYLFLPTELTVLGRLHLYLALRDGGTFYTYTI